MMNGMVFLQQALQHPKQLGAFAPSSPQLSRLMISESNLSTAQQVVELGPGTGVFTRRILNALSYHGLYLGVEQNEQFANHLSKKLPVGSIIHGSAEHLSDHLSAKGLLQCDRIISGLPWLAFQGELQDNILSEITNVLTDEGIFLTIAYYPIHNLPIGRAFKNKLQKHFVSIRQTVTVPNFPPASIYICQRPIRF